MNELLTLAALYGLVVGGDIVGHKWNHWREAKRRAEEEAASLDPMSPLYVTPKPTVARRCARHLAGICAALAVHPTTIETAKGYAIHFVIYSGYVIHH